MKRRGARERQYLLHCVPGLERVVEEEMRTAGLPFEVERVFQRVDERTSLLALRTTATPRDMLALRTVEDLFAPAGEVTGIVPARSGLRVLRAALEREGRLDEGVARACEVRPGRGKPTYRVVARVSGKHAFRRVDMQRVVESVLAARLPGWRLVEDDARIELWAQLVGDRFLLGARLSDATMRHRTYLRASRPAALKPTVAAAMVALSEPRPEDVVLDPMCGSATILIERAHAGRYALLLGGDIDPAAVAAARENVGPRYRPIELSQWDARRLPLDGASVDVVLCNLPFGRQIGTPEGNRALYPALLDEWVRVMRPHGRMVLLSGDRALLASVLRGRPLLREERHLSVVLRGVPATLIVLRRLP